MAKSKGAIIKQVFEEIAADDRCELTFEQLMKFAEDGGLKLPKGKSKTQKDGPKRKFTGWNVYLKFYRSSFDSIGNCGKSWKSLTEVDQGKFNELAVTMTTDRDNGNEKDIKEYDNPLLVPSFEDVDKNGDGVISKEEFELSQEEIKKQEKIEEIRRRREAKAQVATLKTRKTPASTGLLKRRQLFRDEFLDLHCEWKDCTAMESRMEDFMRHVSTHVMEAQVIHNPPPLSDSFRCLWHECSFETINSSEMVRAFLSLDHASDS